MNRYILTISIVLLFSPWSIAQTLDDYFKTAAENNPGLQSKYKEYEAALQKSAQVSSLPDPTFSFGYFISPVETRVGPQQAKFSLTQMFPWFGTLKARGDAAALMAEAKFQNFIDGRNKLYFQVAAAYYPLYELESRVNIEQKNIGILETYKAIATQKYENEDGSMVDVLRVDMMLKDAQTNLKILEDKKKSLLTAFNTLLNRNPNEEVETDNAIPLESQSIDELKDSVILSNPGIKAIDLKIEASKANEIAAKKQGQAKLGIGLDYVLVGKRNDITTQENGKDVIMPMVSMTIPIFRNKYNAKIKEAQLMQESYLYQKEETANTLISAYEITLFEVQQQEELLSLYEKQIQISRQSLNLLFTAYSNSGKDFEEVLRMQQQMLKYQKLKATALSQHQTAIAKINYLTAKSY